MTNELTILTWSAASIGFVHTILGPDHYLPFIMIGQARKWNLSKTLILTAVCGIAHVLSSVLIGIAGIIIGMQVQKLTWIEEIRGNLAAWGLIAFGLAYAVWGLRHYFKHKNLKAKNDNSVNSTRTTPWMLFIIFILGPCEPLIPILMYPAAHYSVQALIMVTTVFAVVTIGTMLITVWAAFSGLSQLNMHKLQPYSHFLAGIIIFASGISIQFLGL
ncbi:sulfite exporter TauE/SafE family protein [Anaerophaga thermohalophila]|uniref:sulfite exporter TauE/SafE family protein n=1 Tax=Anaerophaga thermohalophila TaxID=177400 RepID=UPI000237B8EE|nr:sulfite exporter TauE/SafE family protein [Anaerophaga thermohalophila]